MILCGSYGEYHHDSSIPIMNNYHWTRSHRASCYLSHRIPQNSRNQYWYILRSYHYHNRNQTSPKRGYYNRNSWLHRKWNLYYSWCTHCYSKIEVRNARINDLRFFLTKCSEAGVKYDLNEENDTITVYNSRSRLKSVNFQTNIYPGFPTDLQSPFSLLLTQAEWVSRVHEVLFEWRLNWLVEIEKMRWHIAIMNPHEALIFGKTHLKWAMVSSWDLRAWVTMILAGMIARGETTITNVEYIERGYEDIIGKIQKLWWKIKTV